MFDVPAFDWPATSTVDTEPLVVQSSPLSSNAILRHAFGDDTFSRTSSLRYFEAGSFVPKCKIADGTHCASKSRSSFDKTTFGGVVSEMGNHR